MEKNNNIESKNSPKRSWKWFFTAAITAWMMLIPVLKWNANTVWDRDTKKASTEFFQNIDESKNPDTYYGNYEKIDKDSTAMAYLRNNLFVKWTNIMDPKLNSEITKIWPDQYQIKYDHEFEWLQNYADPTTKKITMVIKFTYKNNNIYMTFEDVKIWNVKLDDNGTVKLSGVIYDYNIVSWENKTLDINSKANKYKTNEMIIEKIKWKWFNMIETFLNGGGYRTDLGSSRNGKCHVVGVCRFWHDNLITRIQARQESKQYRLWTARSDDDVIRRQVDVVFGIIARQFLSVTQISLTGTILQNLAVDVLDGINGTLWCRQVRLSNVKVIHFDSPVFSIVSQWSQLSDRRCGHLGSPYGYFRHKYITY